MVERAVVPYLERVPVEAVVFMLLEGVVAHGVNMLTVVVVLMKAQGILEDLVAEMVEVEPLLLEKVGLEEILAVEVAVVELPIIQAVLVEKAK
jgi:hypothetical protein